MTPRKHQRAHGYRLRVIRRSPTSHTAVMHFHVFCTRTRTLVGRLEYWAVRGLSHRYRVEIRGERHPLSISPRPDVAVERLLHAVRRP